MCILQSNAWRSVDVMRSRTRAGRGGGERHLQPRMLVVSTKYDLELNFASPF